jgi:hypothetical protein
MALMFLVLHLALFASAIIQAQRGSQQFKQIDHKRFMQEVERTESTSIIETANALMQCNLLVLKAERLFILGSFALLAGFIICFSQQQ